MTKPPIPSVQPVTPSLATPVVPSSVTPVVPSAIQPIVPSAAARVPPQLVAPVTTPSASLSPVAPAGATTAMVPCCPDVATFEKSAGARSSYFAFDDTTNIPANVGVDEFWIPPTKAKAVPANRETRDGARWVSVGLQLETDVEINFGGNFVAACLLNCTYEFDPPALAEVTSPAITASGMTFKIKGKTVGEGSLKVICDGKVRGYFHIWCAAPANITVDIASMVSPNSRAAAYVAADLQSYMNDVFRQVMITVQLNDAGAVTVAPAVAGYNDSLGNLRTLDTLAQAASAKLTSNYRLFYYIDTGVWNGGYGTVTALGAPGPGYAFFDHDIQGSYNTMTHELGHLLNLSHPVHDSDHDEFPPFQEANRVGNVLPDDPWNLMGYNGSLPQRGPNRKPLRYLQWKKCNRS